MNICVLSGNLATEPKTTFTANGVARCTFRLAVQSGYTDQNGQKTAYFLNIVTWRNTAENCGKYLTKGRPVIVRGEVVTRSYNAEDGSKRTMTEINAERVEFQPWNKNSAQDGSQGAPGYEPPAMDYSSGVPDGFTAVDEEPPF